MKNAAIEMTIQSASADFIDAMKDASRRRDGPFECMGHRFNVMGWHDNIDHAIRSFRVELVEIVELKQET